MEVYGKIGAGEERRQKFALLPLGSRCEDEPHVMLIEVAHAGLLVDGLGALAHCEVEGREPLVGLGDPDVLRPEGGFEDIEGPAAYLASDASRFHTGDILVVDGGRLVKSL